MIQDRADDVEQPADRLARLRGAVTRIDSEPSLISAARRFRRRLPGDEKFGDPLSTAGQAPVEVIARGVSALQPGRESVTKELGLSALQVWQSLSEATGRGRGDLDVALLFTDLVGFSSWALRAGDAAVLELLREVGTAVEDAITSHDGRIVKRLGDGVMATFLSGEAAVMAALDAHDAVNGIKGRGVLATYARGYPLGPAPEAGRRLSRRRRERGRARCRGRQGRAGAGVRCAARADRPGRTERGEGQALACERRTVWSARDPR